MLKDIVKNPEEQSVRGPSDSTSSGRIDLKASSPGWWVRTIAVLLYRMIADPPKPLRSKQFVGRAQSLQFVKSDREIAHALPGRLIDRVRNRCCNADDADLTKAFDAERIDDVFRLVDENNLDVVSRRHSPGIFGDVWIHDAWMKSDAFGACCTQICDGAEAVDGHQ